MNQLNIDANLELTISNEMIMFCEIFQEQTLFWWRIFFLNQNYFLIAQSENNRLLIQNCNNNFLIDLGIFKQIDVQYFFFELNKITIFWNQNQSILFLKILFNQKMETNSSNKSSFQVYKNILSFDQPVRKVIIQKKQIYLKFQNCNLYYIGMNSELYKVSNNQNISYFYDLLSQNMEFCPAFIGNYGQIQFDLINNSIIIFESHILIQISNLNIIDIIGFNDRKRIFCISYQVDEQIFFAQFHYINFKLFKMFDYPTHGLKVHFPLKYVVNQNWLGVLFKNEKNGSNWILVYKMFQTFSNTLIKIIKVNSENFQFNFHDNQIFYQNENKIYQQELEFVILMVKVKQLKTWNKTFNAKIIVTPILNNFQQIQFNLTLEIKNQNKYIEVFHNSALISKTELKYFDPRKYVQGCIANITSSDVTIHSAFQINSLPNICLTFKESLCVLQEFSMKPYLESNFKTQFLFNYSQSFKSQNKLFIVYLNQQELTENGKNNYIIQIMNLDSNNTVKVDNIYIEIENGVIINNIILIQEYLFIMTNNSIFIYKQKAKVGYSFLNDLSITCNCQIIGASNNQTLFMVYDYDLMFNASIIIINNKAKILIQNVRLLDESIDERYPINKIYILNFIMSQSNQLVINAIFFQEFLVGYIFQLNLDILNGVILKKIVSNIRYSQSTSLQQIEQLADDIFILKFQLGLLSLYNLSNAESYNMIDSVQTLQIDDSEIRLYNTTSLLLISPKNYSNSFLISIQPYEINLKEKNTSQFNVAFSYYLDENSQRPQSIISRETIKFIILQEDSISRFLKFKGPIWILLFFISLIGIIVFALKNQWKKLNNKIINQEIQKEIEL